MRGGVPHSATWWLRTENSGVSVELVVVLIAVLQCSHVAYRLIGSQLPRSAGGGPCRERPLDPDSGRRTDQPGRVGGAANPVAPSSPAVHHLIRGGGCPRAAQMNA